MYRFGITLFRVHASGTFLLVWQFSSWASGKRETSIRSILGVSVVPTQSRVVRLTVPALRLRY